MARPFMKKKDLKLYRYTINIDEETNSIIEKIADMSGFTKSSILRSFVKDGINNYKQDPNTCYVSTFSKNII